MNSKLTANRELNRIEHEMGNYLVICFGIVLIAAIYNVLCIIFWQAVAGMPNAIDNDDGLPALYDAFMVLSMVLVNSMTVVALYSIYRWVPKRIKFLQPKQNKSKWDAPVNRPLDKRIWDRRPGPPVSKSADKE